MLFGDCTQVIILIFYYQQTADGLLEKLISSFIHIASSLALEIEKKKYKQKRLVKKIQI